MLRGMRSFVFGSYDVWNDGDGSKGKKKQAAVDDEQGWGSAMQKREIQVSVQRVEDMRMKKR